jgi:branched-chain amino acid transport system permease protein
MSELIQQIINGITIGCLYALIGLGFSMIFGILRITNFAHGELFMFGPMFSLVLMKLTGFTTGRMNLARPDLSTVEIILAVLICFIGGAAIAALIGVIMERVAYRPIRLKNSAPEIGMIAALGVSLFLQNAAMLIFGHQQKGFPTLIETKSFAIGGAQFTNMQVFILALTIFLLLAVTYLVNKTYLGRCFRAVALDRCAAGLMGVNVNQVIVFVFILGPGIAGISGVLYAMTYGQVYYLMGAIITMKGWIAAVLGGIGNIWGAVLGGFMLGMVEVIGAGYLPLLTGGQLGAEYRNIFAYAILMVFLIIKPEGLFGKKGV